MNLKGWKIMAWVSWGVITLGLILTLVMYLPKRIEYVQKLDKIDNLTWQYQVAALDYERFEVEYTLYRMCMLECEHRIQEYENDKMYEHKYTEEELNKRIEEEIKKEEWYLNLADLNSIKQQASEGIYRRILSELDSLGVPKKTLEIMEEDMTNRVSESVSRSQPTFVLSGGLEKSNLFTIKEFWITRDKNDLYCIFLDEPYFSKGIWYSKKGWWSILHKKWDTDLNRGECKHYKL